MIASSVLIMSRIVYTTNQLFQLGQLIGHTNKPQLTHGIYQRIKSFNILKHGFITHRGCKAGSRFHRNIKVIVSQRNSVLEQSTAISFNNLTNIRCDSFKDIACKFTNFACINTQSARNKAESLVNYVIQRDLYVCIFTETWFKSDDNVAMGDVTPDGFKLDPCHRDDRIGGGIAVLHKLSLDVKLIRSGHMSSYQYMEMLIPHGSKSISLVAIYRPPYHPKKNPHTANAFLEVFASHLEQLILSPNLLCITGDFNFHMDLLKVSEDSLSDSGKEKRREALSSMDLIQHIDGPTHRSGHALDLVITRSADDIFHRDPIIDANLLQI